MRTRAEQKAGTRARLLDAAALLVATRGVEGATVEAIAAAAGVTTGALYSSFAGKGELLQALVTERHTDLSGLPLSALAEDLGQRVADLLSATLVDAQLLNELLAAASRDAGLRALLAERILANADALAARITDEGVATRLPPKDAALAMQVLVAGTVTLQPVLGDALPPALLTTIIGLLRGPV
ncbi:MAG: TetR family transcriptional regulator [Frankiales bacterium]|nr:TetR family transcriptional regulator [Frankiales bacterium]